LEPKDWNLWMELAVLAVPLVTVILLQQRTIISLTSRASKLYERIGALEVIETLGRGSETARLAATRGLSMNWGEEVAPAPPPDPEVPPAPAGVRFRGGF